MTGPPELATPRPEARTGRRWLQFTLLVPVVVSVAAGVSSLGGATSPVAAAVQPVDGRALYTETCVNCHGADGRGTQYGPTLLDEGPAAVDWVLQTGRMPLVAPEHQAIRSQPRFDQSQITAIIGHLQSLGMTGPPIPTGPDLAAADVTHGGEIFRLNCAACHQAVGQGGEVNAGREAPSLQDVDARTVIEALEVGPGVMPRFAGFDRSQIADVAAYVTGVVQDPEDRGGFGIGHLGPVAEGFVIWLVLAVGVLGALRWIGSPAGGDLDAVAERRPAAPSGDRTPDDAAPPASPAQRAATWTLFGMAGLVAAISWIRKKIRGRTDRTARGRRR